MKIVADENIPLIEHYFKGYGQLFLKPGRDINAADLQDADMLLVRSVTKVNQALLSGSSVKFVGSSTSGADHMDTDWLDVQGIQWSVASGCNAIAVAEYVVCVIAALQKMHYLADKKIRAAVVGVGTIGKQVAEKFALLGFEVVLCDPLRTDIVSTEFAELTDLDIISFHTPLTHTGPFPTYHLVQKSFLQKQKPQCVLLNAGRGSVFSFEDLKQEGQSLIWCLDVFENEPYVDPLVLQQARIATPHIAGYSLQSKYRGIEMIYQAAVQQKVITPHALPPMIYPTRALAVDFAQDWRDVVLSIFDPVSATLEMRETLKKNPAGFDSLRKKFTDRYEFSFIELKKMNMPESEKQLLQKLCNLREAD